jgi:hypothetical protein
MISVQSEFLSVGDVFLNLSLIRANQKNADDLRRNIETSNFLLIRAIVKL